MEDTKSLEEMFSDLSILVKELETPDITLEESFKKYNEGMELIRKCNESIGTIEQKLIVLEEEGL